MKKIIYSIVAVLIMGVVIFIGLYGYNKTKQKNEETSHKEYKEDQILLIERTIIFGAGYQDDGFFIDAKGRVYLYSFSQNILPRKYSSEEKFLEKLKDIQKYAKPVMTLEKSVITKAKNLSFDIDTTKTYDKKQVSIDAGSKVLYVCNGDEMVSCRETGDYKGALDSLAAKKLIRYFDRKILSKVTAVCKKMTQKEYASVRTYYYNKNALFFKNVHSGYLENVDNTEKYVVTNKKELAALKKQLGSDFGIGKWQDSKAIDCIFFVEAVNVSSGGYDIKGKGILCQGKKFEIIPSEDSKVPEESVEVTEALDGFVSVAAVPKKVADSLVKQDKGRYFDFEGNEWKKLN